MENGMDNIVCQNTFGLLLAARGPEPPEVRARRVHLEHRRHGGLRGKAEMMGTVTINSKPHGEQTCLGSISEYNLAFR